MFEICSDLSKTGLKIHYFCHYSKNGQMAKLFYFWQTVSKKAKWQPWFESMEMQSSASTHEHNNLWLDLGGNLVQPSISSTLNALVFRTNVVSAAFLYIVTFGFVVFGAKFVQKNARVKRWLNWQLVALFICSLYAVFLSAIFRIQCDPEIIFFLTLSSNLQSSLVFLYANSLYASLFLESLSLEYNEVHLYCN